MLFTRGRCVRGICCVAQLEEDGAISTQTHLPTIDIVAKASEMQPHDRFEAALNMTGAVWRGQSRKEAFFRGEMDPDTLVFSYLMTPLNCRNIWLDGRSQFQGALPAQAWTILSASAAPEAHVEPDFSVLHVYIPQRRLEQEFSDLGLTVRLPDCAEMQMGGPQDVQLGATSRQMIRHARSRDPFRKAQFASLAHQLLVNLAQLWYVPEKRKQGERLTAFQIKTLNDLIHSSLAEPLSVAELAATLGYSRAHFARAFRNTIGFSPLQFVRQVRMRSARELLLQSALPISDVAARVGFDDPSYFARVFRQCEGCTPTELRRTIGTG